MRSPVPVADHTLEDRAQQVLSALEAADMTIVTAESCTAGAIASLLARAEGASAMLHGGFIAYTKEQKTAALGVPKSLLETQGAVNAEVVKRLAAGALERSLANLAIAVSGVLGPEEDEDGNPVGLVYFCVLAKGGPPNVLREQFSEQPHGQLLEQVIHRAFDLIESCARSAVSTRGSGAEF